MKFLKTYFFFFFVLLIDNTFSQSLNDFRTTGLGANDDWTTILNWERFDGSSWIPATYSPGFGTTNDVSIISNHTIILNTDVTANTLNSLTIGDQNGAATSISTLIVGVGGNNTYNLNTNQISILYDGLMQWGGNNTLELLAGTSIAIEQISPYNPINVLGTHYGLYEVGNCSTPMEIVIGGVLYSNCNGKGGIKPPDFGDINNGGGNLGVAPTSNSPVCSGQTVNLFANPSGTEAASATFSWTVISFPAPYTDSLTNTEDTTDTPTTPGTYVYEVTATSGSITNTNSVTVEITSCNKKVITNRRITYRVKK